MDHANDMQAVIDAARQGAAQQVLDKTAGVVFLPSAEGGMGKVLDLQEYQTRPRRKSGFVRCFDAASFNLVLRDNADAGDIAIYFDRNPLKPSVIAVLNGNGPQGPGWSDFRVAIEFRPTPQWVKWNALNGKLLPQVDFAEFLEENLEDVADPAGALMLEIATQLQVVRSVNFKSRVTLSSGGFVFQHDQDDTAKVSAGQIDVPQVFTLGIAPIFGLAAYRVPARFRYRIEDGKLRLGFKLQRVESMMAIIVDDVCKKIEIGANISVLEGLPPS